METSHDDVGKVEESDDDEEDIEAQIKKEVEGLKPKSAARPLIQAIKLDVPCCRSKHSLFWLPRPKPSINFLQ